MSIQIRPANQNDALAACELLRRSITECCAPDHLHQPEILSAWLGNKTPQNVASWFASPSNFALVAERDGVIIGVSLLNQAGKLSLCYVLPEALNSGIGKLLLNGVEEQAKVWGIGVLKLHSPASASGFYAHHGYIQAGKEKSCYGVECDFLWKKLNAERATDPAARQRFCNCTAQ